MSRMTLEQAARWCGGTVAPQYAQVSFLGASNDSRSLEPGQLFVALEGARDGHESVSYTHLPIACMLFTGPTGVGKTELCRALAQELYGSQEAMILSLIHI